MVRKGKESPNFVNHIGEIHITTEGYPITIIDSTGVTNNTIMFECGLILRNRHYNAIKSGQIKNPYHPSVYGVGYYGIGKYKAKIKEKPTPHYQKWIKMFQRCYGGELIKGNKTYLDCEVAKEWHNFQVFAEWFDKKWKSDMDKWCLDKDILLKGNKIYSPDTCCIIPQEINKLFSRRQNKRGKYPIGVTLNKRLNKYEVQIGIRGKRTYKGIFDTPEEAFNIFKIEKEKYIKEVADEWKPLINPRTYEAMCTWVVEITD